LGFKNVLYKIDAGVVPKKSRYYQLNIFLFAEKNSEKYKLKQAITLEQKVHMTFLPIHNTQ
jgi:hypothetical protein